MNTPKNALLGILTCILLSVGFPVLAAEDMTTSVKDTLNLPADFVPQKQDLLPARRPEGINLAIDGNLKARQLKDVNGIKTLYITMVPTAVFKEKYESEPFKVGDLVFALNGELLKGDPFRSFKLAVKALRDTGGKLTFGRWRKGVAETIAVTIMGPSISLTEEGFYDPGQEDWNLGTTGADGWIWASSRETTTNTKEIYITQVHPGSPAAGNLEVGDVILGVNGKKFTHDARKEFANAITESETEEMGGKLQLSVWKDGKTREVTLSLKVMGNYGKSALNSEKVKRIIDDACRHLKEKGVGGTFAKPVNALGLLATGREDVMPLVREYAKIVAAEGKDLNLRRPMASWYWSYANLFLTEYYLATKDDTVLPAIREYATKIAMGQSQVGSWGHKMCEPWPFADGPLYGICPGYGDMNQIGLTCMISLALAKKCGVANNEIELALRKGTEYFKFFVAKGTIPYGDHAPNDTLHEDNGKSSQAAVMFDLLGQKDAAAFYSKMTLASYDEREIGHTGNYWNMLWGPLGAACGGDIAAEVFMKKMQWYFDFERRHDGSFIYQGKAGVKKRKGGENSNKNWDCTGARLLAYCLPLKSLYITGKGRTGNNFTRQEVDDAVAAGGFTGKESTDELLAMLESWSPILRTRAARALESKPENVVPQLISMLDSKKTDARYGACQGLRFAGRQSEAAVDAIITKGIRPEDALLRYFAMYVFSSKNETMGLSKVAVRAVPDLLKLAMEKDPNDPLNRTMQELTVVLFNTHNRPAAEPIFKRGDGIENMDSALLVPAIREMLTAKNAGARGNVSSVFDNLKESDLTALWKSVYLCAREQAPSGVMYSNESRVSALKIMTDKHTREGLATAVWFLSNQRVRKAPAHTINVLDMIKQYGGYAKELIPEMKKAADRWENGVGEPVLLKPDPIMAKLIRDAIKEVEVAKTPEWKMISIGEYIK